MTSKTFVRPADRLSALKARQALKMAKSAHAYVRGSTAKFYQWLEEQKRGTLPEGPPVWICGDCHVGNLGPVASADGRVAIQIRDFDQAVVGNPAHDIIRLALSLATASRGSDLPGVVTAHILGQVIEGYWMKGCSSLGLLRYAVLLGIGSGKKYDIALMDIKEAVAAAAPRYAGQKMPKNQAERVVEGASSLSPHLGKRMASGKLMSKSVFVRELMPQDLKVEIETLTVPDAMRAASFLAGVVGKAHARQMDGATRGSWSKELQRHRSKTLDAPSWLWSSVVSLIGSHETAYLEHCRRYATQADGASG